MHAALVFAAIALEYLPHTHFSQLETPSRAAYFPKLQPWQTAEDDAPKTPEYLPAAHAVQADASSMAENLPWAHTWQAISLPAPVSPENIPAPHDLHVSGEVAAHAVENFPMGQSWQVEDPETENWPFAQP